jgi:hypothetical protein
MIVIRLSIIIVLLFLNRSAFAKRSLRQKAEGMRQKCLLFVVKFRRASFVIRRSESQNQKPATSGVSAFRLPPSAFRLPPSAFRLPPSIFHPV